jgi:hypothetical protein
VPLTVGLALWPYTLGIHGMKSDIMPLASSWTWPARLSGKGHGLPFPKVILSTRERPSCGAIATQ